MIMDIHGGVIEEEAVNNQSSLHFSRLFLTSTSVYLPKVTLQQNHSPMRRLKEFTVYRWNPTQPDIKPYLSSYLLPFEK